MNNDVKLSEENLPYLIDEIKADTTHDYQPWLMEMIDGMRFDARLNRQYYIVKNFEVNGGFVYPFVAFESKALQERADRIRIADKF